MQSLLQDDDGLLRHGSVVLSRFVFQPPMKLCGQFLDHQCGHRNLRFLFASTILASGDAVKRRVEGERPVKGW